MRWLHGAVTCLLITTIAVSHPTVFVQMRPQSPSKHSVCVLALIRVRAVACVAQEIQMQIKDILHKNKINHNFQQKELNKFTSFCELCIIYPTGITSLADCKAEFSHK